MTDLLGVILAVIGGANLLGVSGLYYRLGGVMASNAATNRRQDQLHDDHARLAGRVMQIERNQMKVLPHV